MNWTKKTPKSIVFLIFKPNQVRLPVLLPASSHPSFNVWKKVYFKSLILVYKYWTILDHFHVPEL